MGRDYTLKTYAFFFFDLRPSTTLCKRIKKQSMPPVVILCHQGSFKPLDTTIFLMVVRVMVPKKVPMTLPTPPVRRVPPMMEEAIAFISMPAALVALPAPVCIMKTKPEIPLNKPLNK